jgi:tetratricopeptide (TPR) repeat protein
VDREALKLLGLRENATLTDIQTAYLKKTWQPKFRQVILTDEMLKREFIKYYEAYVTLVQDFRKTDKSADVSYYPPDKVFQFLFNQGVYFLLRQNSIKAGEKLEAAHKTDKKDLLALIYLGVLLLKRKNFYAAEKYFNEAMKIDKDNEDVWFYLAENYFQAGNLNKALSMFQRVQSINPSRNEVAFRLKEVKEKLGIKTPGKAKKSFLSRVFKK